MTHLLLVFAALSSAQDSSHQPIQGKMRELEKTLHDVTIATIQDSGDLKASALKLSELAHGVSRIKADKLADKDPSMAIFAGELSREAKRAASEIDRGNRVYARSLLRAVSSYCIACHTRGSGPSLGGDSLPEGVSLSLAGEAEFLAATRRFEAAYERYTRLLGDAEFLKAKPLEWEKMLRQALVLSVRALHDPGKTLDLLKAVGTMKLPSFLSRQVAAWMASAEKWKKEGKRGFPTEQGYLSEAKRLFGQARQAQEYPADRRADVVFLRASAVLHEFLGKFPKSDKSAMAMHLIGQVYEVLQGLGLWDLHELFYSSCIARTPHSSQAMECFASYQESVYRGYSGSSGVELPNDIEAHLKSLEAQAQMPK